MALKVVPWPKVNEYLLRLEAAKSREELLTLAFSNINDLIRWDSAVFLCDYSCNFLGGLGVDAKDAAVYSEYYRERLPIWSEGRVGVPLQRVLVTNRVYWSDFADSEFVTDFARPRGWARAIGQLRPEKGQDTALGIQRSRTGPDFTDAEVVTLRIVNLHIDNLLKVFRDLSVLQTATVTSGQLSQAFPCLSPREVEIARLFVLGLSAREIGDRFFISVRTVEAHLSHVYSKLGVRAKPQLRARLASAVGRNPPG